MEIISIGEKAAKYFVFELSLLNGEKYLDLITKLRLACNRKLLFQAINNLFIYGQDLGKRVASVGLQSKDLETLFQFIINGNLEEIQKFHAKISFYILENEIKLLTFSEKRILNMLRGTRTS